MNLNLYHHSSRYSFLCPNGTLFQQQYFICDWWFNVDCSLVNLFTIHCRGGSKYRKKGGGFLQEEYWCYCNSYCHWCYCCRRRISTGGTMKLLRSRMQTLAAVATGLNNTEPSKSWWKMWNSIKDRVSYNWKLSKPSGWSKITIWTVFGTFCNCHNSMSIIFIAYLSLAVSTLCTLNTLIGYRKFSFCLSKGLLQICVLESMKLYLKYHFIRRRL